MLMVSPGIAEKNQKPGQEKSAKVSAVDSLVKAELDFARYSVEHGMREAFLEYFADDGLEFDPTPHPAKVELLMRKPTPKPQPFILDWYPEFSEISHSSDFGYNTGPYVVKLPQPADGKPAPPPSWGQFFSVWKKQEDGKWKVAIDIGVDSTESGQAAWSNTKKVSDIPHAMMAKPDPTKERANLIQLEMEFSSLSAKDGITAAYDKYLDKGKDVRLLRAGVLPVVGDMAARAYIGSHPMTMIWTPIQAEVSSYGDLGYAYGSCESSLAGKLSRCFYVHVWRLDCCGAWKLAADILKQVPLEEKK